MRNHVRKLHWNFFCNREIRRASNISLPFCLRFFTDRKKQEQKDIELKEEKKNNNAVLSELSASNRNIAESLNLLKTSIDNNTTEFKQHDERAIQQFNVLNEKLIKINEKLTQK